MGSSITVTIKSPEVDEFRAKEIAEGKERISRCEITGDILSGGNRYVDVRYSPDCKKIMARRHVAALEAALAKCEQGENTIHPIEGTKCGVRLDNSHTAQIWGPDRLEAQFYPGNESGIADGAFHLALIERKHA